MQTLWSRTLRATKCACRCQQCLSYSTAVARRSTTAFRKRLSAIPSSTIIYSAIFACAAVADGRAKQQRRDKWDHAIQEVKDELKPGDADVRTREGREAGQTRDGKRVKDKTNPSMLKKDIEEFELEGKDAEDLAEWLKKGVEGVKDPEAAEAIMREKLDKAKRRSFQRMTDDEEDVSKPRDILEWEDAQRYTMTSSGQPEWPENIGPSFNPHDFPPQSVYATDSRKIEGLESRWTRRKLQTMNLSMAKLVLFMVEAAHLHKYPNRREWDDKLSECWLPDNVYWIAMKGEQSKERFVRSIENFLQRTKMPKNQDRVPEVKPIFGQYPYYEQDPDGQFHRKCHAMNERIFESFDQCFRGELNFPTLVGTICEELLTSPAPPNITTYNALLLGFSRLKRHDICSMVIKSLHEVHMRPDEITCSAALSHHINTNDSRGFVRFVQLMTGISTDSYALMLANPTLPLSHPSTLYRLQNRVVRHPRKPERLVQKVHPTPRVMSSIVAGLLKFHGLERAADICSTLAADGWGFDADALTRFLHACAQQRDWASGVAIWQQLQELRAQRPASRPLDRASYIQMLGLCYRCDRPDIFDQVMREAEHAGGYRARALEKDFKKMLGRGDSAFDETESRRQDWLLRSEMTQQFNAQSAFFAKQAAADAATAEADTEAVAATAAAAAAKAGAAVDEEAVIQKILDDFVAQPETELASTGKPPGPSEKKTFMSSNDKDRPHNWTLD